MTAATSRAAAATFGQQVDHLALQQGGVRVQHDQVLGPPVQPGRLHREIDLAACGRLGQGPPQAVDVGAGHRELVAVHRVRRQPDDPLDVAAARARCARDRLERGGVDLRRQQRDQMALGDLVHLGLHEGLDRHLDARRAEALRQKRRSTGSTSAGTMSASTQSSSRPWTRTCSTSSTSTPRSASAPNSRVAMPGPSCPLTVTRYGGTRLRHGWMTFFSVTQPAPSTQRLTMRGRHAGDHAAVGDLAAHDRAGGHHDVLADLRPGEDHGVGAQPAARADAHRRLGRPLPPDGLDRVLVGVVLVGDVDVGAGLDVVADHDLPVAHDVRAAADEAAAADRHHRIGRHLLPGAIPAEMEAPGPTIVSAPMWIRCSL